MSMSSVLFHLQNRVTVFEILIFSQDIWGDVHYVREINLISLGTLLKAFYLQTKQLERNLRHGFVDERHLKIIMPK